MRSTSIAILCGALLACAPKQLVEVEQNACIVPQLVQRSEHDARRALLAANLQVGRVQRRGPGNYVTEQNPMAGSSVRCGRRVDITVGA